MCVGEGDEDESDCDEGYRRRTLPRFVKIYSELRIG